MTKEDIRKQMQELAKKYVQCLTQEQEGSRKTYIPASGKKIGEEELCLMIEASLDMWLTAGRFNDIFEEQFAKKLGVKYALTTNSGSSANLLAFSALTSHLLGEKALQKGDEVISVAAGFPTTATPIIQHGMVPVFVDCEDITYNIDILQIEKAITPKTKAIFLAHTLGTMYDIPAIMDIAEKYSLWVIEDSCDALGATWNNAYAGTFGHIGTYSFYPAHHLTMGEGGAVVTNNATLKRALLSLRDWGRDCWCPPGVDNTCKRRFSSSLGNLPMGYDHKYTYSHVGYNLKITDWQAAIGVAQLEKLDSFLTTRREHAELLLRELSSLQEYLQLPTIPEHCIPSWFGFLLCVKPNPFFTKQEFVEYLELHGVGTRQVFAGNLLRQPMLLHNDIVLRIGDSNIIHSKELSNEHYSALPVTEYIMNTTFWIGVAQNLTHEDILYVAETIRTFVYKKTSS